MISIIKATNIVRKSLSLNSQLVLSPDDVRPARQYVKDYWPNLLRFHPHDDESLLGLPEPYFVPSYDKTAQFDYNELYYWDSYFMVQGLYDTQHKEQVEGVLTDIMSLFKRFKIVPNASRTYLTGRSQPPFLTSFIFEVYEAYHLDKPWLRKNIGLAEEEYKVVWMGIKSPNFRQMYQGLSRYFDVNFLHDLAEAESGWDMTPRFDRKALQYLPVDLNALLYKYETDFAKAARILGDETKAKVWDRLAEIRKSVINELMWDKIRGLYFDYNFIKHKRSNVGSLAAFYPMWAGMVDIKQAAALVGSLHRFENKGGLATTDSLPVSHYMRGSMPMQWAYPNGWAPLQLIVIQGLERYGYHADAHRLAIKWLKTNLRWFNKNGVFLEKYNVVNPEKPPVKGVYPTQSGFGWTNSVFERLCQDYIDK
ncbi:MAG: trehalase family glycosidase [Candidatus Saccharimonadales bacterium]